LSGVVTNYVHRPFGEIKARNHAVEIDQRYPFRHREAQSYVFMMVGIRSTIPISQEAIRPYRVIVRSLFSFDLRNGGDGEWDLPKKARLEDSLWAEQRHTLSFIKESLLE
jgi:hypothetical protein